MPAKQGKRRRALTHREFAEERPLECSAGPRARQTAAAYPRCSRTLVGGRKIGPQVCDGVPLHIESLSVEARGAAARISAASAAEAPALTLLFGPSTTGRRSSLSLRLFARISANSTRNSHSSRIMRKSLKTLTRALPYPERPGACNFATSRTNALRHMSRIHAAAPLTIASKIRASLCTMILISQGASCCA